MRDVRLTPDPVYGYLNDVNLPFRLRSPAEGGEPAAGGAPDLCKFEPAGTDMGGETGYLPGLSLNFNEVMPTVLFRDDIQLSPGLSPVARDHAVPVLRQIP